jgi:SAM-dependent methyltransferase
VFLFFTEAAFHRRASGGTVKPLNRKLICLSALVGRLLLYPVRTSGLKGRMRLPPIDDQQLVNAHFESTLDHWGNVYKEEGISPLIYQQRRVRALQYIDDLHLPANSRVLEIGCGPGFMTLDLALRSFRVDAIDAVSGMVLQTANQVHRAGVYERVRVTKGDVHNLNFPESRFDLVLMIGVAEWLDSLTGPLKEIRRVLKSGGFLVVSAGNGWPLHEMLDPLLNPALRPVKRLAGRALRKTGLRQPRVRTKSYPTTRFDGSLVAAGLRPIKRATLGFGPFTVFNWPVFSHHAARKIHSKLQNLADRNHPVLRSKGQVYLVVATKI